MISLNLENKNVEGHLREPNMEYEVRENGIWIPVDHGKASECTGGYLRYISDGFAKTALAGEWRGRMTTQYAAEMRDYEEQQAEVAERLFNRKVIYGIIILISLIIIFVL